MLISTAVVQPSVALNGLIEEIAVDADGLATVDFQNIPQTFRHLEIWFRARAESGAATDGRIRFNNDSGANYWVEVLRGIATSASAATVAAATSANIFSVPDTDDAFDCHGLIKVPYYVRSGTLSRIALSEYAYSSASGAGVGQFAGFWTGTTAISRISFILDSAADFKEGSVFSLYGIA